MKPSYFSDIIVIIIIFNIIISAHIYITEGKLSSQNAGRKFFFTFLPIDNVRNDASVLSWACKFLVTKL